MGEISSFGLQKIFLNLDGMPKLLLEERIRELILSRKYKMFRLQFNVNYIVQMLEIDLFKRSVLGELIILSIEP